MKKILGLLSVAALGLCMASCDKEKEPTKDPVTSTPTGGQIQETVTPKDFVASREDNREAVYTHYSVDGEAVESYTSLYSAIFGCVDNGDSEDYVLQKGSETKQFINYDAYDAEAHNYDMYWWYDGGNKFANYSAYGLGEFWEQIRDEDYTMVFKNGLNSSAINFYSSYETVKTTSDVFKFKYGGVEKWHICTELEASATVDMEAYSGITKSVYNIDLSEAKITPAYDGGDDTYAYVGFITADGEYVANVGLRCDTRTGNWYYYSGEASIDASSIVLDEENCYLTSTWDETEKCFRPDGDVQMQMELLKLKDEDGEPYIVHRLTMTFEDGRVVVKDFEDQDLTQCGTIRFTCGMDIVSDNTLVDLMCGAKFENVVITKAEATVYEEMLDDRNYGTLSKIRYAGVYNILNSIDEEFLGDYSARFHTILYNTSSVNYDFDTPNKDVYSFSFDNAPAATE